MTKFTKGPWGIEYGEDSDLIHVGYIDERGIMPSVVVSLHDESNAHLIAAAPDLYEALEYCIDCLGDEFALPNDCIDEAMNALAKARGEA